MQLILRTIFQFNMTPLFYQFFDEKYSMKNDNNLSSWQLINIVIITLMKYLFFYEDNG